MTCVDLRNVQGVGKKNPSNSGSKISNTEVCRLRLDCVKTYFQLEKYLLDK